MAPEFGKYHLHLVETKNMPTSLHSESLAVNRLHLVFRRSLYQEQKYPLPRYLAKNRQELSIIPDVRMYKAFFSTVLAAAITVPMPTNSCYHPRKRTAVYTQPSRILDIHGYVTTPTRFRPPHGKNQKRGENDCAASGREGCCTIKHTLLELAEGAPSLPSRRCYRQRSP